VKLNFSLEHFLQGKDKGLQWKCWTSTSKLHSERNDHVRGRWRMQENTTPCHVFGIFSVSGFCIRGNPLECCKNWLLMVRFPWLL